MAENVRDDATERETGSRRRAADPRPEIDQLTRNAARLAQAGILASTEMLSGSIRILGDLLGDTADAAAKPLRSATERRRDDDDSSPVEARSTSEAFIDVTESIDRSLKELADLVDRSVRRFSDEYEKK